MAYGALALAQVGGFSGETLVTPFVPGPPEWQMDPREALEHADLWHRQGAPEWYSVSIHTGMKGTLKTFRTAEDAPGQKACARFGSNLVETRPVNGYPRLIWRTRCLRPDQSEATILQLAIRGNDHLYHVQKIWDGAVTEQDVNRWINRFRQYGACDTSSAHHPCPGR